MARFAGVSSSSGATAFTRIPLRAELNGERASQLDQGGLAHAIGRHAAGWLKPCRMSKPAGYDTLA